MAIFKDKHTAVVTKKALETGQIGLAYRVGSREAKDSGWRMLYDRNEEALDTANPDKVYVCELHRLLLYFPDIEQFLKEKKYSVMERKGTRWACTGRDSDLSSIPKTCMLPRKTVMNDSIGADGFLVTADPEEMRHLTKAKVRSWELLLPDHIFRRVNGFEKPKRND